MEFDFTDITSLINDFGLLILITFLLTVPTKRKLSNYLLAGYFIIYALDHSTQFLTVFVYPNNPVMGMFINTFITLLFPIYYLFIKASVYVDFKLGPKSLIHLSVFVLVNILLIPLYYYPLLTDNSADWIQLITSDRVRYVSYLPLHAQEFFYFILIFRLLYIYRKLLLENYAGSKMDNFKWLLQFSLVLITIGLIALTKNIFLLTGNIEYYVIGMNILSNLSLVIIFWLFMKVMKSPDIFSGVYINIQLVKKMVGSEPETVNEEKATTTIDNHLITQLQQHMTDNEPYLDPSLSLYDLARQLNIPSRELSITINHTLNKHFFDFVNEYRIEKAKQILTDPDKKEFTVLEILYDVGFNSKSSFNTAFKKHTGFTPTEYRKSNSISVG